MGLLDVLRKLGIDCGFYTTEGSCKADINCIKQARRKSSDIIKRPKTLRAVRKGFNNKHESEEGNTYGYGEH